VTVRRQLSPDDNHGELVVAIGVAEVYGDDELARDIGTVGDVASFGDGELKDDW
jgi:hypothetical protein